MKKKEERINKFNNHFFQTRDKAMKVREVISSKIKILNTLSGGK